MPEDIEIETNPPSVVWDFDKPVVWELGKPRPGLTDPADADIFAEVIQSWCAELNRTLITYLSAVELVLPYGEARARTVEASYGERRVANPDFPASLPETLTEIVTYKLPVELRVAQGRLALFQPTGATEFKRQRVIVPTAPALLILTEGISIAEKYIASFPEDAWPPEAHAPGPLIATLLDGRKAEIPAHEIGSGEAVSARQLILREFRALAAATSRMAGIFGAPYIWEKSPRLEGCKALVRSLQQNESDDEEFLAYLSGELDFEKPVYPYIAQVLMGSRKKNGKLISPGDMTILRKRQEVNLSDCNEAEIYNELRRAAKQRWKSDMSDKVRSVVADLRKGAKQRWMSDSGEVESGESLEKIEETLFHGADESTSMQRARLEGVWKEIAQSAGLSRTNAAFFIRLKTGRASARDNSAAYRAICRKREAIEREKAAFARRFRSGMAS